MRNWSEDTRIYNVEHGVTLYLVTGDGRTGAPFLVNTVPPVSYRRMWVTNPVDYEAK